MTPDGMSAETMGAVGVAILMALLFLRAPIWLALTLVGFFGNVAMMGLPGALALGGTLPFDVASGYTLSVIPLFILMGEVASATRLSADLFNAARRAFANLRGGLSVASIVASACFGAVCGSSIATAATMTRIALPEMRHAGYSNGYAAGSIAAGGTLGILIPPSIILVIYAAIAEQSVPRLFAAALLPGLALTALYIAVAIAVARFSPGAAREADGAKRAAGEEAPKPWQFLVLFVVTIGGIYAGVFSPTEAAAIGAAGAILLGVAGARLPASEMVRAVERTVVVSCTLFLIIMGANIFSSFVVQTHLPEALAAQARAYDLPPLAVMMLIVLAYVVMGCFLEGIGMVLITVPVFLPLVVSFGYDPIWFAILVVVVIEVGLITPPVGMNLFIIQANAPGMRMSGLYGGVAPFLIAPFALIALLFMFPQMTLWLPNLLYGR